MAQLDAVELVMETQMSLAWHGMAWHGSAQPEVPVEKPHKTASAWFGSPSQLLLVFLDCATSVGTTANVILICFRSFDSVIIGNTKLNTELNTDLRHFILIQLTWLTN